jgi:hypothetical protein
MFNITINLFRILFFFIVPFCGLSQSDTIITNVERIPCTVREVTADAIKFSYPQEELVNTIYKNAIKKVIFKSGRVQTYAESIPLKPIKQPEDYEYVEVTHIESDTKGLYRIGSVSAKAKGTTMISNQIRVENRAFRKIKILAAMMGANLVLMSNQRNEGNKIETTETNITGTAYSNSKINIDEFKKKLNGKHICNAIKQITLWAGDYDYRTENVSVKFYVNEIIETTGNIEIKGSLGAVYGLKTYKLVGMDEKSFNIYYEDKSSSYNLKVLFNQ